MKKFICTVCGYIYEGETAPEKPAESAPQTADFSMIGAALVLMSSASLAVIRKRR